MVGGGDSLGKLSPVRVRRRPFIVFRFYRSKQCNRKGHWWRTTPPPPRANRCADLAPVAKQGHARGVDASNLTAGTLPPGDTHLPMLAALVCRESRQANSSSPCREPETTMNMGRRIAEPMANAAPKHGASWGETGKAMLGVPSLSNFMPFPYDDSRRSFQGNSRCHGRWAIAPRRALAQALLSAGRSGFASPRTRVNQ